MHNLCLPLGTSDKHQNNYLISFVILSYPPYPRGKSKTLNLGQVFWLISLIPEPSRPDGQWRYIAAMGAAAHPESCSEKYSSGTVRESHPCSLLNLTWQIPQFQMQMYKKWLLITYTYKKTFCFSRTIRICPHQNQSFHLCLSSACIRWRVLQTAPEAPQR